MLLQVSKTDKAYFIEAPASTRPSDEFLFEVKFRMLAASWREERKYLSFAHQYANSDSFRAIVAMGPPVVPLVLAEQKADPHPGWLRILEVISGKRHLA